MAELAKLTINVDEETLELLRAIDKKLDIIIERGVIGNVAPDAEENTFPDTEALPFPEPEKAEVKEEKPKLTVDDLRKKAVELSAAGKKAEVREIVKKFADRVTAIPEDKYEEVWVKLSKLEGKNGSKKGS